jgi:hypothetical protein
MFAMSVNEVPGWSVLIVPRLIGVPVAATPGLVPHDEVSTAVLVGELDAEEAAALVAAGALEVAAGVLVELVELELHAARTPSDSSPAAAAAVRVRQWTGLFMCSAFLWLTARLIFRTGACSASRQCLASQLAEEDAVHRSASKRCFFALH